MKKDIPPEERREVVDEMAEKIEQTLNAFDVPIKVVKAIEGLRQYHFHLKTLKPIRMKAIESFEQDLRYALGSSKVEIQAPMPDETLIGITVPKMNAHLKISWHEALKLHPTPVPHTFMVPLGTDEFGNRISFDFDTERHVLIGGVSGSGKTMLIHSIINSLIAQHDAHELRFIILDPKRVDYTAYEGLPHLLAPVITDPKSLIRALKWAIIEMERRFSLLQNARAVSVNEYHTNIKGQPANGDEEIDTMPRIVIVLEELSDVMMAFPKELEACIVRLAQMSSVVGIHLLLATQRPSVNVVTGTMKANIPSRIALQVASQIDSRVILDRAGAEKLQLHGDMLVQLCGSDYAQRLQGYYLTKDEIIKNVKHEKNGKEPLFTIDLMNTRNSGVDVFGDSDDDIDDDLYEEARIAVLEAGKASTSYLQRKLKVGYSRAARLIDLLEQNGVIASGTGSKPRTVIREDDDD